ncbi:hypothetical protein RGUI_0806 [Rhodovulum sp. P5]|uniref:hypothetical protein n=1 Tax=Rhodovulum phage vB_RhkS_P1 TaxID=1873452 RepID=UPI00080A977A|nr:hypothetical protein [Rhodovulum sp. P5]YP_009285891.1 hypothetical protein BI026_gp06 [Rhodovulum phage vB_RhkS_P1]ANT39877.1 hypothetical protein Rhks_6 [Rhodovulum phage vB_RhkS_P1]ARE38253.1 hypothetical protein RGUI_0112 [Rhodovulum sp. P5]ARE38947.1 hypothetical protein RGUI_0806 [Rhodovulum sp. P5]
MSKLRIELVGGCYVVFDGGKRVGGQYSTHALAAARMENIQRARERAARVRKRPCLCCGHVFDSEGAHNRLCPECRRKSAGPDVLTVHAPE